MPEETKQQPVNLVFVPVIVYAMLVINKEYGETQANVNEKLRFDNLDAVEGDLDRVRETLTILGIPKSNITVLKDATYDELDDLWDDSKKKYRAAEKSGKTLFIFWYGGHGEMAGSATTWMSLNETDPDKRCFAWES